MVVDANRLVGRTDECHTIQARRMLDPRHSLLCLCFLSPAIFFVTNGGACTMVCCQFFFLAQDDKPRIATSKPSGS
jgi:hypothetical protein